MAGWWLLAGGKLQQLTHYKLCWDRQCILEEEGTREERVRAQSSKLDHSCMKGRLLLTGTLHGSSAGCANAS